MILRASAKSSGVFMFQKSRPPVSNRFHADSSSTSIGTRFIASVTLRTPESNAACNTASAPVFQQAHKGSNPFSDSATTTWPHCQWFAHTKTPTIRASRTACRNPPSNSTSLRSQCRQFSPPRSKFRPKGLLPANDRLECPPARSHIFPLRQRFSRCHTRLSLDL